MSANSESTVGDAHTVGVSALLEQIVAELRSLREATIERAGAVRDPPPDVLTCDDFAALLRVDVRTLRAMRHAGEVPRGFMVGASPRWKRSQIEAWIAKAQR